MTGEREAEKLLADAMQASYERSQQRERELVAENERLRESLAHYADEGHWTEDTPPPEVNTAGYLGWGYDGGHEFPWTVAREALGG